jgi:hypothetical protein
MSKVRDSVATFWRDFRRGLVVMLTDKEAWCFSLAMTPAWIYFVWLAHATGGH